MAATGGSSPTATERELITAERMPFRPLRHGSTEQLLLGNRSVRPWSPSAVRGRRSERNRRIACDCRHLQPRPGPSHHGLTEQLRSSQFVSDDFQNELAFLGIDASPAFVRKPEGNACIERFFRSLKEQLLWVRHFPSVPELVRALEEFRALYNQQTMVSYWNSMFSRSSQVMISQR